MKAGLALGGILVALVYWLVQIISKQIAVVCVLIYQRIAVPNGDAGVKVAPGRVH